MRIDVPSVRRLLKEFDFKTLFREQLGWDNYQANLDIPLDGTTYSLIAIVEKRGFQVFTCPTIPDRPTRLKLDRQLTKSAREHLIIYTDPDRKEQLWEWVRREPDKPAASRDYRFRVSQSGDALIQKLEALAISLEEEEELSIVEVAGRVKAALDVDKITRRFYDRFKAEHATFMQFIKGIKHDPDLQWYTSLMLNRLMFVYFIQKKGFLDGDVDYLRNRLARMRQQYGKDKFYSFYRYFLLRLFHEGLGQSAGDRKPELDKLLGKVPFLDGGFFEVHDLEQKYPDIDIPDAAFENLFAFFDAYRWHLDERPLRADNEINPDVVGYIFEKYINQKQMGAYYTKEDITEYISKNTVIPFLFDAAEKKCAIAFKPDSALWRLLRDDPDRYIYPAVRHGVVVRGVVVQASSLPEAQPGWPHHNIVEQASSLQAEGAGRMPAPQDDIIPLPPEIEAGVTDVAKRGGWNKPAPQPFALPTETWREHVARRQRCLEIREKLRRGEVHQINDLVTLNLDIWQFARDAIVNSEGPELLRAFYRVIAGHIPRQSNEKYERGISVLDPTCGSGAFLFAALRILETLYSDCLEGMRRFLDEDAARMAAPQSCGAGFQPAGERAGRMPAPQEEAGKMPAPQQIMARCEPRADAGSCVLKRPEAARIVQDALLHFEGQRYHLISWCVMPNHVHVIFTPVGEHTCSGILHSWKSFTANEINKVLGRKGTLWERESFDHVVRSLEDLERFTKYVEGNPVTAGLCAAPKDWAFSSCGCGAGFQPAEAAGKMPAPQERIAAPRFVEPSATPFAPLKFRGELPHLYKEGCTYFATFCLYDACGAGFQPAGVPGFQPAGKDAGRMPAPHEEAGRMPAPQQSRKYADFRAVLEEVTEHPNERYYVLKSIIINNLFGVDIMEEAVEICKLRLFLKLVAQVETAEQIEPLPDIDFNIRAGNTLVGYVSLDEVRRSQAGTLGFGDKEIKRIEEDALIADAAYKRFRETQVRHGGAVTARDKAELRKRLSKLDAELDRYLAGEYGIDCGAGPSGADTCGAGFQPAVEGTAARMAAPQRAGKMPAPQFDAWKASHRPFHWLVEFFGIMRDGGFDVIIGNPPYLESRQVDYRPVGLSSIESAAIHAMCVERSTSCLHPSGCFSMIVPLALVSTQRMTAIQRMVESARDVWYSNYAWRPGKLFDTVNRALTIFVAVASDSARTFSTNYQKWNSDTRSYLMPALRYVRIPRDRPAFWAPKLGNDPEASILNKCMNVNTMVAAIIEPTKHEIYYRTTGGLYWKVFTDFSPAFRVNGKNGHSSRETSFSVARQELVHPLIAALSSDLFWWWYSITSNLRDLNPSDIQGFPLPGGVLRDPHLAELGHRYLEDLVNNSTMLIRQQKQTGKTETQCFKIQRSKPIIDKIDQVLARHYGFTDEELDFIINYDIKYRMGGSDDGEDGVK